LDYKKQFKNQIWYHIYNSIKQTR